MIDRKAILKQLEELVEQAEIMEHHNETLGFDDKVKEYEAMGAKYEYLSSLVEDDLEKNPDNNDDDNGDNAFGKQDIANFNYFANGEYTP